MCAIFKFLLCALVVWCGCTAGQASLDFVPPHPAFGGGRTAGGATAIDPVTSANCFEFYIREQQRISTAYSRDYNNCLLTSRLERERVQNDVAQSRAALTEATAALCGRIRACNSLNDTLQMFQCHSKSGGVNIRTAYDASDNSTQIGSVMLERFRMIGVRQEQCTHNVRRTYISDVGKNYNTLQNCLAPPLMMFPPGLAGGGNAGRPVWYPKSSSTITTTTPIPTTKVWSTRPTKPPPPPPTTTTATPETNPSSTTTTTPQSASPTPTVAFDVPADEFATTEAGADIVAEVNANLQKQFAQLFKLLK